MPQQTAWSLTAHYLRYWSPALLWVCVIVFFSTDAASSASIFGHFHFFSQQLLPNADESFYIQAHIFLRKLAHLAEYFVLGILVFRGFRAEAKTGWLPLWAVGTLLVVALVAVGDEWHQYYYLAASRSGTIGDVLLDVCGGGCAVLGLYLRHCWR